jgi:hypothetical protein
MRTTRFWNNIHQVRGSYVKSLESQIISRSLGASKPMDSRKSAKGAYTWGKRTLVLIIITLYRNCTFQT